MCKKININAGNCFGEMLVPEKSLRSLLRCRATPLNISNSKLIAHFLHTYIHTIHTYV